MAMTPVAIHRASLPAKIAGSVFWGLALIGFLTTFFLLRSVEDDVMAKHAGIVDRSSLEIVELFVGSPGMNRE